ncbi:hypothetical protein ACSNOI_13365 [Actinomadura kijaniata]|uniref:hypothetical protein n=1 Tax=Actinomadura kijaniata TaxID=46161 RepID=UPI003F1E45CC
MGELAAAVRAQLRALAEAVLEHLSHSAQELYKVIAGVTRTMASAPSGATVTRLESRDTQEARAGPRHDLDLPCLKTHDLHLTLNYLASIYELEEPVRQHPLTAAPKTPNRRGRPRCIRC